MVAHRVAQADSCRLENTSVALKEDKKSMYFCTEQNLYMLPVSSQNLASVMQTKSVCLSEQRLDSTVMYFLLQTAF